MSKQQIAMQVDASTSEYDSDESIKVVKKERKPTVRTIHKYEKEACLSVIKIIERLDNNREWVKKNLCPELIELISLINHPIKKEIQDMLAEGRKKLLDDNIKFEDMNETAKKLRIEE